MLLNRVNPVGQNTWTQRYRSTFPKKIVATNHNPTSEEENEVNTVKNSGTTNIFSKVHKKINYK